MSNNKKNYKSTNRYNKPPVAPAEKVEAPVIETVEEPVVENVEVVPSVVESVTEVVEVVKEPKVGTIIGCDKLNVRKKPNKNAEVVCVINKTTVVEIDEEKSTGDFYKVYLPSGIDGFCMKQFIKVN